MYFCLFELSGDTGSASALSNRRNDTAVATLREPAKFAPNRDYQISIRTESIKF